MVTMMVIMIAMDCDDNGAQLIQALPIQMIVTKICTQPRRIDINFKDNPTKDETLMKMHDTQDVHSYTLVKWCTCVSVDMMMINSETQRGIARSSSWANIYLYLYLRMMRNILPI